jgi:hypothetical protein
MLEERFPGLAGAVSSSFSSLVYVSPLIISLLIVLRFGLREGNRKAGGNGRRQAMGACTDCEVEHPA